MPCHACSTDIFNPYSEQRPIGMFHTFSSWYQGCFQDLKKGPEFAGTSSFLLLLGQCTGLSTTLRVMTVH